MSFNMVNGNAVVTVLNYFTVNERKTTVTVSF